MDTHKKLCQSLDERGWTEYRLSKECGLSESTPANIFSKNTLPSISTLEALCKDFGITVSQFFAEGEMVEMTPEKRIFLTGFFRCWYMIILIFITHQIKIQKAANYKYC